MSTEIRPLTKKGVPFYPQTHVKAIVNDNGSGVDSAPTKNSNNLVESGGVFSAIFDNTGAFDISRYNAINGVPKSYSGLTDALSEVPQEYRSGGMTVKFVLSSDNKYVQYRYMPSDAATVATFTNVANWQGVDDELQAVFSKNLVSGGAVRKALGNEKIDWIANKYINLSGGVGTTVPSPSITAGWGYCDIPCDEGSLIVISGNGGNYGLWGFVNNEDKIISWSGKNINKNDLQLIAPEGAVRVIVNSYSYSIMTSPVISLSDSVEVRTKNTIIGTDNILDDAVTTPKINDSAVTKAKVADKAITIEKTNFDLIDSIVGSFDYTGSIAELYIFAPVAEGAFVSVKVYGSALYVTQVTSTGISPAQYWTAITSNSAVLSNGEVCLVKCSTANESLGVSVGDVVGYVVFKDIDKIKSYNDETRGYRIKYTENTYTLTKNPIIASSLHKVSDSDLADNFIKAVVVNNTVYDARYCIAEFYLKEDAVVFNNDSHKYVICKVYGNALYIQSYNGTTNYGWQSVYDISNWKNNTVYELKVTAAGLNENYEVGDVVGYIAFKDITKFKTLTSSVRPANVIRDNVTQIRLSPMIYAYLQSKDVEIDNVLTFANMQIPNDIYVVEGNQLMLFYKSIVKSYNPNIYGLRVVCSVGKAYPKYYILDATNTGDYSISFNVVDKDDNIISTKTSTIHVISAMSAPSANKNVLVFGASTMADGSVTGELKRRLTESSGDGTTQNPTGLGLSNITFVGRKQGTTVNVNQEATGGWSWKDYSTEGQLAYRFNVTGVNQLNINDTYTCNGVTLTIAEINVTSGSGNIRCTYSGTSTLPASGTLTRSSGSGDSTITYTSYDSESYNPFWNPNKTGGAGLDFTNYANEYCNGSIDVMIACCGYNDFNRYTPATISNLFTDYVKPFIRAYHAEFPNGKFIISTHHLPTPDGGMAANYGAASNWNWLTTAHKIWAFAVEAEKLVKESEFSSYVYLSEVTSEFDCEHSYPTAQAYVNNRSSVQETVTTNGVHFTTVGAYQVSDSLYHAFNRLDL